MIESPILQELRAQWTREGAVRTRQRTDIARILKNRWDLGTGTGTGIEGNWRRAQLDDLLDLAATCRSLASFRKSCRLEVSERFGLLRRSRLRSDLGKWLGVFFPGFLPGCGEEVVVQDSE